MQSMTGYGRAELEVNSRAYTIEIKAINHKYNDISIKLPRTLIYMEEEIKKTILKNISRGKIDIYVTYENYGEKEQNIIINDELARKYINEYIKIASENGLETKIPISEIMKMPDVIKLKESEENQEQIEKELIECLKEAISNFINMRKIEGQKIKEDLIIRIKNIEENVEKISQNCTGLIEEYVVKLKERIQEILTTNVIDENRLATEIVIYADKCSIQEELTRLKSHINQFINLVQEENPIGKKMDFLIQEMNRETNTIGSKSGSLNITNLVIDIKTELEDIREQIQNIQ